jgi:hypothetical protein
LGRVGWHHCWYFGQVGQWWHLKINNIEKNVSLDHTRPCIYTSNKNKKIHPRIHSTVQVIRARIFRMWSVLEVTQRVPPTCIIKTDFTYRDHYGCVPFGHGGKRRWEGRIARPSFFHQGQRVDWVDRVDCIGPSLDCIDPALD